MKKIKLLLILSVLIFTCATISANKPKGLNRNKKERLEWFTDLGFGMFIHFSFDSQLGVVISHSMVGASDDYLNRFVNELPKTFNPKKYDPVEMANLAKLAGMKYIVFTTKHHSGFCMWDTQTTDFNIMNTPYGKDLLAEYVTATRNAGLGVGFYFSPEDFNFLYENGIQVRRRFIKPIPEDIMDEYLNLVEQQSKELMTQYGNIDMIFFDGGDGPLVEKSKKVVWEIQPNIIVTRGAIKTPEQTLLRITSVDPWESCITMGTQWAWKPTNENYKSGNRLIQLLIETRATGGNLLLNVGPKSNGELPEVQEANLREIAAWNFVNYEAIENVRPWVLPNEENIWFTYNPNEKTLFAILTGILNWERGKRKKFVIKSAKLTDNSQVTVLGQSGELVEYQPKTNAKTYFKQKDDGIHISCVRAQRIYNDHKWHNPITLKITDVEPALVPPKVISQKPNIINSTGEVIFRGELLSMGDSKSLNVGFQYKEYKGLAEELYNETWIETKVSQINTEKKFEHTIKLKKLNKTYQVRAFVQHEKIRIYANEVRIKH